jgi:hypothetical protein
MRQAYIALSLMLLDYGVRAYSHHLALERAPAVFGHLPRRCRDAAPERAWIDTWPRAVTLSPRDAAAERCLADVAAIPDFFSPFGWQLIAQFPNAYERRSVDLLDAQSRTGANVTRLSVLYPNQWTPAVQHAAMSDIGSVFLGFSRYPAARSTIDRQGIATVLWTDIRFATARIGMAERETSLFLATIRVAADGSILEERLGR